MIEVILSGDVHQNFRERFDKFADEVAVFTRYINFAVVVRERIFFHEGGEYAVSDVACRQFEKFFDKVDVAVFVEEGIDYVRHREVEEVVEARGHIIVAVMIYAGSVLFVAEESPEDVAERYVGDNAFELFYPPVDVVVMIEVILSGDVHQNFRERFDEFAYEVAFFAARR